MNDSNVNESDLQLILFADHALRLRRINGRMNKSTRMTTVQAAKLADVTPATIRNWVNKYNIGHKSGARLYVDPDAFMAFLRENYPHQAEQIGGSPEDERQAETESRRAS